eukprot:Nk52_evm1s81 gene=Nk52_evmTU1s81
MQGEHSEEALDDGAGGGSPICKEKGDDQGGGLLQDPGEFCRHEEAPHPAPAVPAIGGGDSQGQEGEGADPEQVVQGEGIVEEQWLVCVVGLHEMVLKEAPCVGPILP